MNKNKIEIRRVTSNDEKDVYAIYSHGNEITHIGFSVPENATPLEIMKIIAKRLDDFIWHEESILDKAKKDKEIEELMKTS